MDIQEQIDQFLQIPEIKEIFSDHDIHWHVGEYSQGWYFDFSVPDYEKGFFLGAWNAWQAVKAQAVPEGFVLVEKTKLMQIVGSAAIIEPITRGNPLMSKYKTELDFILSTVRAMIKAQEPAND